MGDMSLILAPSGGFLVSANVFVLMQFISNQPVLLWYDESANLMASFKCSTFSHPTGDIEDFNFVQ